VNGRVTSEIDITVVVPAYQAEPWLRETLNTVAHQTCLPRELIVVDDGSADGTCRVVDAFALANPALMVRLERSPHRGPGAARNMGVAAATSPWVAFLDSDDLWHPRKLECVRQAILARPDGNLFCHNEMTRFLDGREQEADYGAGVSSTHPFPPQLYRRNCFSTSAVVCRRDVVLDHGGFDEELSSAQDYELWLRLSPALVPVFVTETLGTYVMRSGNISSGRVWRRYLNAMRVRHRHRDKAGWGLYLHMVTRDTASYAVAAVRTLVQRTRTRSG
jgi:GT2 family glycosyltransferase